MPAVRSCCVIISSAMVAAIGNGDGFLFVQAAWVTLVKVSPNRWEGHGLKPWIEAAKKRLRHNVLANKLARIAWSVLARGRGFEANKLQAA
jgi:transposase